MTKSNDNKTNSKFQNYIDMLNSDNPSKITETFQVNFSDLSEKCPIILNENIFLYSDEIFDLNNKLDSLIQKKQKQVIPLVIYSSVLTMSLTAAYINDYVLKSPINLVDYISMASSLFSSWESSKYISNFISYKSEIKKTKVIIKFVNDEKDNLENKLDKIKQNNPNLSIEQISDTVYSELLTPVNNFNGNNLKNK
jgi:hypothetical protein